MVKGKGGKNVMYGTRLEAKLDGLAGQVSWLADELWLASEQQQRESKQDIHRGAGANSDERYLQRTGREQQKSSQQGHVSLANLRDWPVERVGTVRRRDGRQGEPETGTAGRGEISKMEDASTPSRHNNNMPIYLYTELYGCVYKIYKIKPSTESRSPVPAARMAGRQTAVDRSMHIIRTAPRQVN
ncbi:hypothetical protein TESG_03833 [Trichophyton tonsurans CBS 112818]|uniref:Uncharacterized protein n=1 Tax=Trichophyton tonsurans (strain CBS 112818) TaxID=647933 RepID=F2RYI6_TRIT1|nr:hypothetical protein TESG_03833 [Trichophyton tonsurans CBS 112818]